MRIVNRGKVAAKNSGRYEKENKEKKGKKTI